MSSWNPKGAENVLQVYILATRLKSLIRTGWVQWRVSEDRLESVAEHVFGTMMLAIAIWSEYNYHVDLCRVILMLAIHETEEIYIKDITPYDGISKEEKTRRGHEAVEDIFKPLIMKKTYSKLIEEFDEGVTDEAVFAYKCDKLDADLMAILYDNGNYPLGAAQEHLRNNRSLQELEENGAKSMSDFFYEVDKSKYDEDFLEILDTMRREVGYGATFE